MTQIPTDALRLVPVEPTDVMIEAGCRALHAAQGTGDADAPLHSPPQNSWEEPDSVRWKQWRETITDDVWPALVSAAPASPRPEGGGQLSGITGELDPRLVEWGYTSLDEAITHLGKLLDDQTAFDGLGDLIAELKEAKYLLGHVSASTGPAHDLGVIAAGYKYQTHPLSNATYDRISAFLARNGEADLQKMQNNTPRNAPRGLSDEC